MQSTVETSFCHVIQQGATYFCPLPRYCEWDYYSSSVTDILTTSLNYNKDSWNYADSINTQIEMTIFSALDQEQLSILEQIGFDEKKHDCCHSHYETYGWSEFPGSDGDGIRAAWESLGYDEIKWDSGVLTEFVDYYWDELSEEQQNLLVGKLCYTRELWNGFPIPDWGETAIVPGSSEKFDPPILNFEPKCREIDPSATYFCPVERYCEWNTYMDETTNFLTEALGYDENSWNFENITNDGIERVSYYDFNSDQINALQAIGFSAQSHDCCQLHYEIYEWSDFSGGSPYDEIRAALELIGYTEELWNTGTLTESADQFWDDLTDEQQTALSGKLCYTRELWDQVPIQDWPTDAKVPGATFPTNAPTPFPSTHPTSKPTKSPTVIPTANPTAIPTSKPTKSPTVIPTANPTAIPTSKPIKILTEIPTTNPTVNLTSKPTQTSSTEPNITQMSKPTGVPTSVPTELTSFESSAKQSAYPATVTTIKPSEKITNKPSIINTRSPTSFLNIGANEANSATLMSEPTSTPSPEPSLVQSTSPTSSHSTRTESPSGSNHLFPTTDPIVQIAEPTLSVSKNDSDIIDKIVEDISTSLSTLLEPTTTPSSAPIIPVSNDANLSTTAGPSAVSTSPSPVPVDIAKELNLCHKIQSNTFHYCPTQRYCDWEGQSVSSKAWLTNELAYEKNTWNYYATNPIEASWFEDLPQNRRKALKEMGIDLDRHECCFNHYMLYDWSMFDRWGMTEQKAAWEVVGYDEEKWDGELETEYDNFWFEELPEEVQYALTEYLCYTAELWNQVPLDFWSKDAALPGTYPLEEEEEEVDSDPMDETEEEEKIDASTAFSFFVRSECHIIMFFIFSFFAVFSVDDM